MAEALPEVLAKKAECARLCGDGVLDPEVFFPTPALEARAFTALAICSQCTQVEVCRDWAEANKPIGIWGGKMFKRL